MEDIIFYTSVTIQIKDDIQFTFNNVPVEFMSSFSKDSVNELLEIQWYMHGAYDRIVVLGSEFTILSITKKKVVLVRSN